jgi:hypothetical protein
MNGRQRGIPRVGAGDIGAVEFGGLLPALWLPLIKLAANLTCTPVDKIA